MNRVLVLNIIYLRTDVVCRFNSKKKTSKARIREVLCPNKNIPIYDNIYTQAALFLYIVRRYYYYTFINIHFICIYWSHNKSYYALKKNSRRPTISNGAWEIKEYLSRTLRKKQSVNNQPYSFHALHMLYAHMHDGYMQWFTMLMHMHDISSSVYTATILIRKLINYLQVVSNHYITSI
jgi:hypothetical protein